MNYHTRLLMAADEICPPERRGFEPLISKSKTIINMPEKRRMSLLLQTRARCFPPW
jgi:hypothetical protein